jgi:hypothetical protein
VTASGIWRITLGFNKTADPRSHSIDFSAVDATTGKTSNHLVFTITY